MDGRGRYLDNIFIERLWRSLKYECVYLHESEDGRHARELIGAWLDFYNHSRPHSRLGGRTPASVCLAGRASPSAVLAGAAGNAAGLPRADHLGTPEFAGQPSCA